MKDVNKGLVFNHGNVSAIKDTLGCFVTNLFGITPALRILNFNPLNQLQSPAQQGWRNQAKKIIKTDRKPKQRHPLQKQLELVSSR